MSNGVVLIRETNSDVTMHNGIAMNNSKIDVL